MYAITAPTGITAPARLLKPAALLHRLRPVRLGTIAFELRAAYRKARALSLIKTHFPHKMVEVGVMDHWTATMRQFLGYVEEAEWFEINWRTLDYLWQWAGQVEGEEEDELLYEQEAIYYFAEYLWGVPVGCYGLLDQDFAYLEEMPPMMALAMMVGVVPPNADFLYEFEIYDMWDDDIPAMVLERLEMQDFTHLPEPLCWLPEMADLVQGETGNVILDSTVEIMELNPRAWLWDNPQDVAMLRQAWQEAHPTVDRLRAFVSYFEGPEQLRRLGEILLEGSDE